jgi:hypothetical protein
MKKQLISAFVLLAANAIFGMTNQLDLGTGDTLIIDAPTSLEVIQTGLVEGHSASAILTDTNGECQMRLSVGILNAIPTKEEMKSQMINLGSPLLADSEEKQILVQDLPNKTITLQYFELNYEKRGTDDARFMLNGVGTDGKKYVFQLMMLSSQNNSPTKSDILKAISTMRIEKKR